MDPITTTAARYAIAVVAGSVYLLVFNYGFRGVVGEIKRSAGPGLILAATLNLQIWGLEYTTATKSGFISTLYVVIVPVLELIFFKRKLHPLHWLWVAVATLGTALMVELYVAEINVGDIMTLVAAVTASIQILWIGEIANKVKSPLQFNIAQSIWGAIGTLPFYLVYSQPYIREVSGKGLFGFLWLALASTLIAFALQLRAQRTLSPAYSSLLYLVESPLAMFFAYMLLTERLNSVQVFGAGLIFTSAVLATLTHVKAARTSLRPDF